MPSIKRKQPIAIKFVRSPNQRRAVLIDSELNLISLDQLHRWAARRVRFSVTDADSGEDITRILMA